MVEELSLRESSELDPWSTIHDSHACYPRFTCLLHVVPLTFHTFHFLGSYLPANLRSNLSVGSHPRGALPLALRGEVAIESDANQPATRAVPSGG
jgi:hypothetical protein